MIRRGIFGAAYSALVVVGAETFRLSFFSALTIRRRVFWAPDYSGASDSARPIRRWHIRRRLFGAGIYGDGPNSARAIRRESFGAADLALEFSAQAFTAPDRFGATKQYLHIPKFLWSHGP